MNAAIKLARRLSIELYAVDPGNKVFADGTFKGDTLDDIIETAEACSVPKPKKSWWRRLLDVRW